jgi:CRISPR-associated protein Csd2
MGWEKYIPKDIAQLYEIHDFRHAAAILSTEFPTEFEELCKALRKFRITKEDVIAPGGNESQIPKKFSDILSPMGWQEKQLTARIIVEIDEAEEISLDSHKVDYLKGRVACDLEWNSKDQTYDRDLYAFRAFYEYNKISLGVLVTRSNDLDPWFEELGTFKDGTGKTREVKAKYGASTTQMGKLIPRLKAGRNGGCPVLVFGITTKLRKR